MKKYDKKLGESLGWMEEQLNVTPKFKWRETFKANLDEYKIHDGKTFQVLAEITDDALRDETQYGYVRVYSIRLDDGTIIQAFEDEVEELPKNI
jgi:hypothetical protein